MNQEAWDIDILEYADNIAPRPITLYKIVEDFDKLVIFFESGIFNASEFKFAKTKWIDKLQHNIKPAKVPELLAALLPYLKNNALEEEEVIRIRNLG